MLGLFCSEAAACSCPVKTFDEFVKNADEIYFATLEEAKVVRSAHERESAFIAARFDVRRTFKGAPHRGKMMLRTGLGGGDCGIPMLVSQTYIIFKQKELDGIGDCDGSGGMYHFQEDEVAAKVKAALKKISSKSAER